MTVYTQIRYRFSMIGMMAHLTALDISHNQLEILPEGKNTVYKVICCLFTSCVV